MMTQTPDQPPATHDPHTPVEVVTATPPDTELFQGGPRKGVLRFGAKLTHPTGVDGRGDLTVTAHTDAGRTTVLTKRLRFGADQRRYTMGFTLPEDAVNPEFTLTSTSGPVTVRDPVLFTAHTTVRYTTPTDHHVAGADFTPYWAQDGRDITVRWLGDTYTATMPNGFDLTQVPTPRLELAGELLFGEAGRLAFGRSRKLLEVTRAASPEEFELDEPSRVLLCYSAGEDSTAALDILPADRTVAYYNERNYTGYHTPTGAPIAFNPAFELAALDRVPGLVRVPNDFETIGLAIGIKNGYQDGFGYAAIAALLAGHYGCNVIAFGSVMEQIFMKSGYNFSDVVNYRPARLVAYRSLFRDAGLYFSVPTGALSEVLTHQIAKNNRHGYVAVPCPATSETGDPCGACFKCFRKLRFDHGSGAPDPSPAAEKFITARPMKSATSVVAAAQIAGETRYGLGEYADTDVSFLHRYYRGGLAGLVPADMLPGLEAELAERGIEPMTLEDEFRLRTVAQLFDPGNFSMRHAFPGAQAERFRDLLESSY